MTCFLLLSESTTDLSLLCVVGLLVAVVVILVVLLIVRWKKTQTHLCEFSPFTSEKKTKRQVVETCFIYFFRRQHQPKPAHQT